MNSQEYKGGTIRKTYHHEYGGYVWQTRHPLVSRWVEPFLLESEAKAFLQGVEIGIQSLRDNQKQSIWGGPPQDMS